MKLTFCLVFFTFFFVSCRNEKPEVLIYIEDSTQLSYMLKNEALKMKEILELSGFEVKTATLSGEVLATDSATLVPDYQLANVKIDDFAGFILPCMASDFEITKQEVDFVRLVAKGNKPCAAQVGAVQILARAGILKGKKYCFPNEKDENPGLYPEFRGAEYCGNGVITDGKIITSGTCPWMAKMTGQKDGTVQLTTELINVIRSDNN